jgi:integrase
MKWAVYMTNVVSLPRAESRKRRHAKLNEDVLQQMRVGERIYDTLLGGFYVERGKRGWSFRVMADLPTQVWRQKSSGSQTLERKIGMCPPTTPKAARAVAQRVIGLIKSGVDPKGPHFSPDGPTLQQAWEDFKSDYLVKKDRSPNTVEYYRYCYTRLQKWHAHPLAVIVADRPGIRKMHDNLSKSSGKRAANASLHFAGLLVRHARGAYPSIAEWPERAYVPHEGEEDTSKRGMGPEDGELREWWQTVLKIEDPQRRELLLFTLLTGLRSHDARTARIENLNEAERTLFIPAPKGHRPNNPKRNRAFHLPLTEPMMDCIRRAGKAWLDAGYAESPYLFPSARASGGCFTESRTKAKVKFGHDLRRSWSTCAEAAGFTEAEYGILLNHKSKTVTGKYVNRDKLNERKRTMMTEINRVIVEALGL